MARGQQDLNSTTYSVRRLAPHEARDVLIRLWAANLKMDGDLLGRYRWAYRDNPCGEPDAFVLDACGPDTPTAEPVGCAALLRRRFFLRGSPLEVAVFADFAVLPAHRTLLPAIQLQRSVKEYLGTRFAFGYGLPNEHSRAIFRRVGQVEVGSFVTYRRCLDGAFPDSRGLLDLEWLHDFDERFDDLWDRTSPDHCLIGDRSAAFLRWRFLERPVGRRDIAALVEGPAGDLRAYAVVEFPPAGGSRDLPVEIRDFLGRDEQDLLDLLRLLLPALAHRGGRSLALRFLGPHSLARCFGGLGFERVAERPLLVDPGAALAAAASVLLDGESWYLTDCDKDW